MLSSSLELGSYVEFLHQKRVVMVLSNLYKQYNACHVKNVVVMSMASVSVIDNLLRCISDLLGFEY